MAEFLVFTLTAALGAMGEFAGHERRGSLGWPGRSAVLGLVAAARGITRDDAASLQDLESLRMAVAVFDEGVPLRDYHTAQTVPSAKARRPDSRRAAFAEAGLGINTTITLRDYRQGCLFGIALWGEALEEVRNALEEPVFTLYLGRKSCPLAAPMAPALVQAADPLEALRSAKLPPWRGKPAIEIVASDRFEGLPDDHIETRNDVALDRTRWHFGPRDVLFIHPKLPGGAS